MNSPLILYLCSSWPLGRAFGGQLRALHIGRALKEVGEVTVAVVSSDADDAEAEARTRKEFAIARPILPEMRPNRSVLEKLQWGLNPRYLNVHGFVASLADRNRLFLSFDQYDLIWVLNSRTPNILQRWHWPKAHLDLDDVPSTYARSGSRNGDGAGTRLKAGARRFLARRRELLFKERFTTLSVCSEADRQYLGGGDRIHVIPNGFERPQSMPAPNASTNPPRIGFIGLYSHSPNLEGVRWFLKNCWPVIRREAPGIRFRLAGQDTDGGSKPTESDVDSLGWIADPAAEIATWSAMIIPIRLGGGTRVKIADAFSRKCPVVSTRLGAFGYEVENGRELLMVEDDDAAAFAAACVSLVRNPAMGAEMAERAFSTFLEKWTWDAIAPRVWAAAEDCLRRSKQSVANARE